MKMMIRVNSWEAVVTTTTTTIMTERIRIMIRLMMTMKGYRIKVVKNFVVTIQQQAMKRDGIKCTADI